MKKIKRHNDKNNMKALKAVKKLMKVVSKLQKTIAAKDVIIK